MILEYIEEVGPVYNIDNGYKGIEFSNPIYMGYIGEKMVFLDQENLYQYKNNEFIFMKSIKLPTDILIVDEEEQCLNLMNINIKVEWKDLLIISVGHKKYTFNYQTVVKPTFIQILSEDRALITIHQRHLVVLINKEGEIIWSFGNDNNPGMENGLCSPRFCIINKYNNNFLISDTLNARVIEVDPFGNITWQYGKQGKIGSAEGRLWRPFSVTITKDKLISIVDSGNKRVLFITREGEIIHSFGNPLMSKSFLTLPRSVQLINDDTMLIANTFNNKVQLVNSVDNSIIKDFGSGSKEQMYWPRCANFIEELNILVVGDGRNNRILFLDYLSGKLKKRLSYYYDGNKKFPLGDPHHILYNPNNQSLLVTLSLTNEVVEINTDGKLIKKYAGLEDPHSAQFFMKGVLVTNSGANNLIYFNKKSEKHIIDSFLNINTNKNDRFNKPRFTLPINEKKLLVLDTAAHRLLYLFYEDGIWKGFNVKIIFPNQKKTLNNLFHPRWLQILNNHLLLTDTGNCRVIKFQIKGDI